jgi:hypothetical protein
MVKAVAAGAVLVAAALPVVAMTAPAGAATGPSLTCTDYNPSTSCPTNNFVIVGQGFSGTGVVNLVGTGFANDQAVGGVVTATTSAPGVTLTNVMESSATLATADINVPSSTTPGFYPVTLTDSGGSATLTLGIGVDHGPQVATVAGNVGTNLGASSTVQLTGSFLNGATVYFTGTGTVPTAGTYVNDASGKTLSFDVANVGTPGTFTMHVQAPWPSPFNGQFLSTYKLNATPTPVTITSVVASQLGIPLVNPSTNLVTIHGTGFQAGAVLTLPVVPGGVSLNSYTFVNSTTMTATITVPVGNPTGQVSINILNPDTTSVLGTAILGIGVPATNTVAGPPTVVAPEISLLSGALRPGTSTILNVNGSSTFPMTVGSTVKVSLDGSANPSETVSGTVLAVDANNNATIQVKLPRYATTTLTAAVTAPVISPASTTLTVGNTTGMTATGVVVIYDGLNSQEVSYTGTTPTTLTGVVAIGPLGTAITTHPVGAGIEFPFPSNTSPAGSTFTLSVNNGVVTETAPVPVITAVAATFTSANGSQIQNAGTFVNPGSYTFNAYVPGFGFSAGSLIVFNNPAVTGTVTVVNGNTATLHVTVASGVSAPNGTLAVAATPGQNALQLSAAAGATLAIGDKFTVNADPFYLVPETFTVTGKVADLISVSTPVVYNHSLGATITKLNAVPSAGAVGAGISNGAGQAIIVPSLFGTVATFFSIGTIGTAVPSLLNVGQGANEAPEVFGTLTPANGDLTASHWTVSSTTAGVTFGAVTVATAGAITATVSVAPGTAVAANVPVTITNGLITYSSTINIVAGPTVTGVTAVPSLTGNSSTLPSFVGIYGTNLVNGMLCSTPAGLDVQCAVFATGAPPAGTDTATTRTIYYVTSPTAANGTYSVTLMDPTTYGRGTFAGAVTVTGQPTVSSLSPSAIPASSNPTITATGTGFPVMSVCSVVGTESDGVTIDPASTVCTATKVSATSATITGYSTAFLAGDTLVFTFGSANAQVVASGVTVYANPNIFFMYLSSTISSTQVAQGSTAVPFKLVGSGFLPGAKVSLPTTVGTATVTEVTPNAIFGTLNILATAPTIGASFNTAVTVTNTNGGSKTSNRFDVVAAPSITSVSPNNVLEGQSTTLTITGTGFYAGAVVTAANSTLATYGAATVSNGVVACTGPCTTLTVKINPLTFQGNTPILTGFTITNPVGAGSVSSSATALSINPVPSVTGTYYVPTFTTNTQITISGNGFQAGITASSANPDYKVLLVSSTANSVVLLVTTTANATAGTSSVVTLTNPDGGSTTFPLNGGPNPNTLTPAPHAVRVIGAVWTGKTTDVAIVGTNFYGQPRITSNAPGTRVGVFSDNGKVLRIHVTVKTGTKKGVHTFIIVFKNGEQTHVKYNQR